MTKIIELSNGTPTYVDDEDYDKLMQHCWTFNRYAYRIEYGRHIDMHREILNYYGPLDVDHINRNTYDNRKKNLRTVTKSINQLNSSCNSVTRVMHVTGYVTFKARIQYNGKPLHLGEFPTFNLACMVTRRAKQDIINGKEYINAFKGANKYAPKKRVLIYVGENND